MKYGTGTGTVPFRRIILVRHNDKNKKTIKKVYPTGTGTLINKSSVQWRGWTGTYVRRLLDYRNWLTPVAFFLEKYFVLDKD